MSAAAKILLNRFKARLSAEETSQNRRVARALIAQIEIATPMRNGEATLSDRLRSNKSGSYLFFCVGFFGGVSVVMAIALKVFS